MVSHQSDKMGKYECQNCHVSDHEYRLNGLMEKKLNAYFQYFWRVRLANNQLNSDSPIVLAVLMVLHFRKWQWDKVHNMNGFRGSLLIAFDMHAMKIYTDDPAEIWA
jgi:hypothetical protein